MSDESERLADGLDLTSPESEVLKRLSMPAHSNVSYEINSLYDGWHYEDDVQVPDNRERVQVKGPGDTLYKHTAAEAVMTAEAEWVPSANNPLPKYMSFGEMQPTNPPRHLVRPQPSHKRELVLICMVMDEAHTIERTLLSVRGYIDRWCILDTGSTDGTQEIVINTLRFIPGALYEEPFISFGESLNRLIELEGNTSAYVLRLDADDVLVGGENLRGYLDATDGSSYLLGLYTPGSDFDALRIWRNNHTWRYRYPVHELLVNSQGHPTFARIPGVRIDHFPTELGNKKSEARWDRDIAVLKVWLEQHPDDHRMWFYFGMTYYWKNDFSNAYAALQRRIELEGGWSEEVFFALLTQSRIGGSLGMPEALRVDLALRAHALSPLRAEPLSDLATFYHRKDNHALCILFSLRALLLEHPQGGALFTEPGAYVKWVYHDQISAHCWAIGDWVLGEGHAKKAFILNPGDARVRANLDFYVNRRLAAERAAAPAAPMLSDPTQQERRILATLPQEPHPLDPPPELALLKQKASRGALRALLAIGAMAGGYSDLLCEPDDAIDTDGEEPGPADLFLGPPPATDKG